MNVPNWYGFVLLALAAWRTFHLLAFDDIVDRFRRKLLRLNTTWKQEGDATGLLYRERLASFVVCPFCFGFWITVVWWFAWLVFPTETVVVAVPFALNAGLIGAQRLLSSE